MTRPRIPGSIDHAVLTIAAHITYAEAARVVGRTVACIRDWTNDATTAVPSMTQALALDAAYRAAGGEGAPLYEAYGAQLDLSVAAAFACRDELADDLEEAAREAGEALAATVRLTREGHSPNDAMRSLVDIDQANTAFTRLSKRVRSFLTPGTGPAAGSTGGEP